jgi:adenylate cyclase
MKKLIVPISIGLLITGIFTVFSIMRLLPLERLEQLAYDTRYKIRGYTTPPQEVVIVGIDDKSLEKIGRWPWDRSKVAALIDLLKDMGAKVIMMDIIFSEPSKDDEILAASIKRAGNVILPVVFEFKGQKKGIKEDVLPDYAYPMIRESKNFEIFSPISGLNVMMPLKNLVREANTLGYINMIPDKDGVLRWELLAIEYDGELYPSIDLQTARVYLDMPMEALILNAAKGVNLGDKFIPTDFWNRTMIHYYGPQDTFPHISVIDLFEGKINKSAIKDKAVLIGATAVGIYDLRVTPTSPVMPGIEKHASVIAAILHDDFIVKASNLINVLIVIGTGILFSVLIVRLKAIFGALLSFVLIAAISLISYYLFFEKNLWIDTVYSSSSVIMIYFVINAYKYATEERYAKRIRGMFSSYVTEKVVDELIKNPELAKLGGERREMTVLFSDVRGFTTFSEKHGPEKVVAILNEYLGEMTNIIFEWDGTLDKFVGDEIVAFWGAPLPQADHAERAVKCALHMVRRLEELQEKWKVEGREPLYAGFGINTGEVIVGNIGAEGKKMDYTVIGDNVNLGARVEGLTRKYDADIIITEFTLEKLRSIIEKDRSWKIRVKGFDAVAVKGKAKPVCIYGVKALGEGETPEIIECEVKDVVTMTEK